jgi:uncharacterized membrane protein YozB (DUF420 family)
MIDYAQLPALNAILNGTAAVLILTGIYLIKTGRQRAHRAVMISAVVASSLFLTSYLTYHAHAGSKHFPGHGWARDVYLLILLTHTVLAAIVVPLVLVTLTRGLKGRFDRHRPIARWTYPVWLYVSVTGVVIYVMLYHLYA